MSDNIEYTPEITDVLGPELDRKLTRKSSMPHYGKRAHRKIPERKDKDYLTTSQLVVSYIILFAAFILSVILIHKYYDSPDSFLLFLVITFGSIAIIYSYTQYKINTVKGDVISVLGRILLYLVILLLFLISVGAINDSFAKENVSRNPANKIVWPGFILLLGLMFMLILEHYKDIIGSFKYMYTGMIILFAFVWLVSVQINKNRNKSIF